MLPQRMASGNGGAHCEPSSFTDEQINWAADEAANKRMRGNKARPEAAATQSEYGAGKAEVLDSLLGLRSDTVQQESFLLIRKLGGDPPLVFGVGGGGK